MAMRSALGAIPFFSCSASVAANCAAPALRSSRFFSDGKGKVLSEEERAVETVYIQKMERERLEKLKKKQEAEKAETEKKNEKKPNDKN